MQLIIQFLGESLLICLFAFTFAVLIVQLILPVFNELSNKALAIILFVRHQIGGRIYSAYFFLLHFWRAFIRHWSYLALIPCKPYISRFNLSGKNYLQKCLVVLQFSLASFLIIATLTIYAQFNYLTTEKLGYDDSNLVGVKNGYLTRDKAAIFKAELLKNPNIVDVCI